MLSCSRVLRRMVQRTEYQQRSHVRCLAKKAATKDDSSPQPELDTGDIDTVVRGLNIMKDGADPPIKDDSEYPDWVFELTRSRGSLEELKAKEIAEPGSLSKEEQRRLIRLWNRDRIKQGNAMKKK